MGRCRGKSQKNNGELELISRFIIYYQNKSGIHLKIHDCDVPTDEGRHNYDFLLVGDKGQLYACEVSLMLEKDTIFKERAVLMEFIQRLRCKLQSWTVEGYYLISVPVDAFKNYDNFTLDEAVKWIKNNLDIPEGSTSKYLSNEFKLTLTKNSSLMPLNGIQVFPLSPLTVNQKELKERTYQSLIHNAQQLEVSKATSRFFIVSDQYLEPCGHKTMASIYHSFPLPSFKMIDSVFYEEEPGSFYLVFQK